jgi:hypothetical protein
MIEDILHDWHRASVTAAAAAAAGADGTTSSSSVGKSVVILRYFNPVGAHPSGM